MNIKILYSKQWKYLLNILSIETISLYFLLHSIVDLIILVFDRPGHVYIGTEYVELLFMNSYTFKQYGIIKSLL